MSSELGFDEVRNVKRSKAIEFTTRKSAETITSTEISAIRSISAKNEYKLTLP